MTRFPSTSRVNSPASPSVSEFAAPDPAEFDVRSLSHVSQRKGTRMTPSIYGPGPSLDRLMSMLHDMGAKPARWERKPGQRQVWLYVDLPSGREQIQGESLDEAARNMIVTCLTSGDGERDAATALLA